MVRLLQSTKRGASSVCHHVDGAGCAFDDQRVVGGDGEPQVGAPDGVGVGGDGAVGRAHSHGGARSDEREGEQQTHRHGNVCVCQTPGP